MRRILRALRVLLLVANVLAALSLLLSYLSLRVSPADFWLPSLFSLLIPVWIILNTAFVLYWLVRWKRYIFISLLSLVVGIPQLVAFFRFHLPSPPYQGPKDLTVMSYNVNLFRLYAWSPDPPTHREILSEAARLAPDIFCLQEFCTREGVFPQSWAQREIAPYSDIHYIVRGRDTQYGIATFSRYPIVDGGVIPFEGSVNACIFTDILVGGDTIRIYNTHLQSFRFGSEDLEFIRNPSLKGADRPVKKITGLVSRISKANRMRAVQAQMVREHIRTSPHPVIVCGDFNDSPVSFTYHEMLGDDLRDAFLSSGDGFGTTYRNIFPSFRIDYILHSAELEARDFQILNLDHSDHYPIHATFTLKSLQSPTP